MHTVSSFLSALHSLRVLWDRKDGPSSPDNERTPFFEMQDSPRAGNMYTLTVKGAPVGLVNCSLDSLRECAEIILK